VPPYRRGSSMGAPVCLFADAWLLVVVQSVARMRKGGLHGISPALARIRCCMRRWLRALRSSFSRGAVRPAPLRPFRGGLRVDVWFPRERPGHCFAPSYRLGFIHVRADCLFASLML
jgi:hypothetical protein